MSDRKCPYCNEHVPSYSLTCPKCYRNIPREEKNMKDKDIKESETSNSVSKSVTNKTLVLLLAFIPSAFGLMGLGQIYEREYKRGLTFLAVGLFLFIILVMLINSFSHVNGGWSFITIGATILVGLVFIGTYLIQAFDALVRSLFVVN